MARRVRNTIPRVAFRWLAGRPLDGYRRTDATFGRPGRSSCVPGVTRPSRWSLLPGWQRSVWRQAGLTLGGSGAWLYVAHRVLFWTVVGLIVAGGVAAAVWVVVAEIRRREHHRQWVRPLAAAVAPQLGVSETAAKASLDVPRDFDREGSKGVRVDLPESWGADQPRKALVAGTVAAKLGLVDPDVSWRVAGAHPHLLVKPAPRPPKRVDLDDVSAEIASAPDSAPVLGMGRRGQLVSVDLDHESPHVLISAGTGAGKSVLIRAIAAQALAKGAEVTVLDVKRSSHRWARGLPGVTYLCDPGDINDHLVDLAAEADRRQRIVETAGEGAHVGTRRLVVAEEMNATTGRVATWWADRRGPGDPKTAPGVKALQELLFMGRTARTHVIASAQLGTARSLGGPEARENFGTRILARYSLNAWRMLVPEVWPAPRSSKHPGRCQVAIAGHAVECQALYLTDDQARHLATAPAPVVPIHTGARTTTPPQAQPTPKPTPQPEPPLRVVRPPIGLAEAARTICAPLTLSALRNARKRDEAFPQPVAQRGREHLYSPDALARWRRNRDRGEVAS